MSDSIYLIIGIDPGINVGYAALDLNGKLVGAGVTKQKNANKVVGLISQIGIPLLVACDVSKPPSFVKSVAAKFNVKVFSPSKNLTQESKRFMAKNRNFSTVANYKIRSMAPDAMDIHVRDAYAAAIKAYRKYSNRFRRIDKIYSDKAEEYKRLVLEGKPVGKFD
ncbi:MAG: DUF460 domain-containing protein [Candidatus Micrarchaeota archaeon]